MLPLCLGVSNLAFHAAERLFHWHYVHIASTIAVHAL